MSDEAGRGKGKINLLTNPALPSRLAPIFNPGGNQSLNITDILLEQVLERGHGGDAAILCGDDRITYEMLSERVNRVGNVLIGQGIKTGERVLMIVRDTPAFFYSYLGLIKTGAVPVALNLRLTEGDLAYVINDSQCRFLLIDHEFLENYGGLSDAVKQMPGLIMTDEPPAGANTGNPLLSDLMEAASPSLTAANMEPGDPAFWVYSSGPTGQPKGVVHCHGMIEGADNYFGQMIGVKRHERVFCTSKLFFAYTLGHALICTLALGATAILYPDWPDAQAIAEVIEKHKPTVVLSVPTFYRNLLRDGSAQRQALKDVRCYISAGEKLSVSLFDEWKEATGRVISEGIGASETIYLFIASHPDDSRAGFTGRPTPGTEVKMMDLNGDPVTEAGVPGILWVKLIGNAKGYWQLEEKTREIFVDGWYCTKDMFIRDEGDFYEYQGRGDDMLKISGQWVSPTEIEEVALAVPDVLQAAVVGVTDRDGLVRLAMFMVADNMADGTNELEKRVRESLTGQLAVYKCPRRIYFIDEMPLTGSGKLQRFQLRGAAQEKEGVEAG